MKILKDPMIDFVPANRTRLVILGTMASYVAREINGEVAKSGSFYYHDGRNRFWGTLSLLLTGKMIKFADIENKSDFLNYQGVALANLVDSVEVDDSVKTSLDDVLFEAYGNGRLRFKSTSDKMKTLLEESPVFFSCFRKSEIEALLNGYKEANNISKKDFIDKVVFLHSPTRRGYQYIANKWRESILSSYPEILS